MSSSEENFDFDDVSASEYGSDDFAPVKKKPVGKNVFMK